MNALADKRQVTADEVCSQVTRCVADAKTVLQHLDSLNRPTREEASSQEATDTAHQTEARERDERFRQEAELEGQALR